MSYVIVIPNRYPDVIQRLLTSLKQYEPNTTVCIIADGHDHSYGYNMIKYPFDEFRYARSVNLGIKWAINSGDLPDIVLLNDDCILLDGKTLPVLEEQAKSVQPVGILSPMIKGSVGNPAQRYHERAKWWRPGEAVKLVWSPEPVCFPCVYIKRDMIKKIGLLDESRAGYGYDDNEYCNRARAAGYWTAISPSVVVQHGDGSHDLGTGRGTSWSVSFARRERENKKRLG
jgi:GT2 family glycosyltransferase